jgi:hypothetical protein
MQNPVNFEISVRSGSSFITPRLKEEKKMDRNQMYPVTAPNIDI